MKKVVIIGGKGTAVVIAEQIQDAIDRFGYQVEVLGFAFDDVPEDGKINGWPVLCGTREAYPKFKDDPNVFFIFALYRADLIKERTKLMMSYGIPIDRFYSFVHPTALITKSVKMGKGCIILANCVVNSNAVLGNFNYLMTGVIFGHDSTIGDNNFIAAHNCLGACMEIGNRNFFGVNSNFKTYVKIGDNNIIGQGANVIHNIGDNSTVVGNPAKVIKVRE